jgi:hypothetical protein
LDFVEPGNLGSAPLVTEEGISQMKNEVLETKQMWETPSVAYQGTVGEILQGGGGKISVAAADPGEQLCEKPHCPSSAK